MPNTATFLITTARSGTQWLCASLRAAYPDLLAVEHEPIRYAYAPKRWLRDPLASKELRRHPTIRRHLDAVHRTLESKSYVEVGFPAFAAAPLLWEEFGPRLQLVHLVRHPVRVAASIVTHHWFNPRHQDIQANIALEPTDPGVVLRHYDARWAEMSPFERALFYWAEVHLYGLEVEGKFPAIPFLRVAFEDLLSDKKTRAALADFLGVPDRPEWHEAPAKKIDSYRFQTSIRIDGSRFQSIPEIPSLGARFGYDVAGVAEHEIRNRYQRSWLTRLRQRAQRSLRKTLGAGPTITMTVSQLTGSFPT